MKNKIMFIVPSMRGGGSERVISILLKYLSRTKYDIILVLLKNEGKYLDDLPNDIKIIDLNVRKARFSIFKIRNAIKRFEPDIVFSTLGHLNLLISMIRPFLSKKIKFIARESNTVSIQNKQEKYPNLFNFLYKFFYNNFDLIVCQSNYMKNDLINNYDIKNAKIVVINNPVDTEYIKKMLKKSNQLFLDKNKVNLLAVGRLSKQKGYDLLLQALSKLDKKFHLTILGEGNEEIYLKALAKTLKIQNQVLFMAFQENPYKYMSQADLYILSSRYEGFPNVVLEAHTCGTPVVAFDCPGGTSEIIENGVNGFLCQCGKVDALVEKINKASLQRFDKNKIKNLTVNKYDVNIIITYYEKVLL